MTQFFTFFSDMDSDKEFEDSTLLDLPGVEEVGTTNIDQSEEPSTSSGVDKSTVKPSGSGFTFFLNSSMEDDSDDEDHETGKSIDNYSVEDTLESLSVSNRVIKKTLKRPHEESSSEENMLQKELTERYISGQLSFTDYIRQIGSDDEDEENEDRDEEDSDEDEEWVPSSSDNATVTKKKSKSKASMNDFASEFQRTAKQQLGKKLPRLGNLRGGKRKKLDPTLQGLMGEANLRFARGTLSITIS